MWTFECAEETGASRASVWALWSEPARWPEFNPALDWARLDGPFTEGAKGVLKPRRGWKSKFVILAAEPERRFASTGKLPLARLHYERELAEGEGGRTRIVYRVRASGPLGRSFARRLKLSENEVASIANLARIAIEQEGEEARPSTATG